MTSYRGAQSGRGGARAGRRRDVTPAERRAAAGAAGSGAGACGVRARARGGPGAGGAAPGPGGGGGGMAESEAETPSTPGEFESKYFEFHGVRLPPFCRGKMEEIANFPVRPSDVWIVTYPKSGEPRADPARPALRRARARVFPRGRGGRGAGTPPGGVGVGQHLGKPRPETFRGGPGCPRLDGVPWGWSLFGPSCQEDRPRAATRPCIPSRYPAGCVTLDSHLTSLFLGPVQLLMSAKSW